MKKDIAESDFIEWAEFSGNMYGTRLTIIHIYTLLHCA